MNDVEYIEEYSLKDLIASSGRPLRFDFAVLDDDGNVDFFVEFQGEQHYVAKSKFGGAKGLAKQRFNDKQKRLYCQKHNIPLVIIPYWDYARVTYDYIFEAAGY